ncbi:MAG TPA: YigZ family protein, partial [Bacteroidia bacterium]|nr:YigZ family protein [Bacteroidia bacterium]
MLFSDTYLTITSPSEGIFKDRGSKFIAYAFPVANEVQAKEHLAELRKEHFSARHHCYAFRLGADKQHFRANDDGEPSGTGGKPILGQL